MPICGLSWTLQLCDSSHTHCRFQINYDSFLNLLAGLRAVRDHFSSDGEVELALASLPNEKCIRAASRYLEVVAET